MDGFGTDLPSGYKSGQWRRLRYRASVTLLFSQLTFQQ